MSANETDRQPTHTHYDPYRPPFRAVGTLLDCSEAEAHNAVNSELWAEYRYDPYLVPSLDIGLPPEMERDVLAAYMQRCAANVVKAITDVTRDPEYGFRVTITNRTSYALNDTGPTWHTEEWGLYPHDGLWHGIPKNPHPGYEHMPPWCSNCGY